MQSEQQIGQPAQFTINSTTSCAALQMDYPTCDSPSPNIVVCAFSISSFQLFEWQEYTVQAQVTFGTMSTSNKVKYVSTYGGVVNSNTPIGLINSQQGIPTLLQTLYGLPNSTSVTPTITQGILALDITSQAPYFDENDVQTYMANLSITSYDPSLLTVVVQAGVQRRIDQFETSVDVELIMAIAPGVPTVVWYAETLLTWAQDVSQGASSFPSGVTPPSVWSISYDVSEAGYTSTQINRINTYLQILAGQGISVFAASGDQGAGYNANGIASGVYPEFPATSPYVTAVGATELYLSPTGRNNPVEIVCSAIDSNSITSGGGFSAVFAQPSYQQSAVSAYINAYGASIDSTINTRNRAYPDISALGANVYIVAGGSDTSAYGTSASSPIVAGMFSLINQARQSAGKPTMGMVNPFLYNVASNNPSAFTDVIKGDNCVGEIETLAIVFPTWGSSQCYVAANGWDPVTGLGSINYNALLQSAMSWVSPYQAPLSPQPAPVQVPVPRPMPALPKSLPQPVYIPQTAPMSLPAPMPIPQPLSAPYPSPITEPVTDVAPLPVPGPMSVLPQSLPQPYIPQMVPMPLSAPMPIPQPLSAPYPSPITEPVTGLAPPSDQASNTVALGLGLGLGIGIPALIITTLAIYYRYKLSRLHNQPLPGLEDPEPLLGGMMGVPADAHL